MKRELVEHGFTGVEMRQTPQRIELVIRATRTTSIRGEKGRRIRELISVIKKRFNLEQPIEIYVDKVFNRGLSAFAQAESVKQKLVKGMAVRRACYGVVRYIMDSGAKGVEVIVSGKLRQQRAKAMKFRDGYILRAGQPMEDFVDLAIAHVYLRQGVLGVKVRIILPTAHVQKLKGNKILMPGFVIVKEPKEEGEVAPIAPKHE